MKEIAWIVVILIILSCSIKCIDRNIHKILDAQWIVMNSRTCKDGKCIFMYPFSKVLITKMTRWPSGLRRNVKAVVFIGVGSNPTRVTSFASFSKNHLQCCTSASSRCGGHVCASTISTTPQPR